MATTEVAAATTAVAGRLPFLEQTLGAWVARPPSCGPLANARRARACVCVCVCVCVRAPYTESRRRTAERTLARYPNRVPIVLVKGPRCVAKTRKDEDFLVVPDHVTMGDLLAKLRTRVLLNSTDGVPCRRYPPSAAPTRHMCRRLTGCGVG
jgi:hypothetical protein